MVSFSRALGLAPCPGNCTNIVAEGVSVTKTAQPGPDMWFLGWNSADGECEGTIPTCTFNVNKQATLISAKFGQKRTTPSFTLSYSRRSAGGGSGALTAQANGAAIACNDAVCATTQPAVALMTLSAVPDHRSRFAGWSGACQGSASNCNFRLIANDSTVATFQPQAVSLTILKSGPEELGADLDGQILPCPGLGCTATGPVGAVLSITATPASGSAFIGWSGACKGASARCSIPLPVQGGAALATFSAQSGKQAPAR